MVDRAQAGGPLAQWQASLRAGRLEIQYCPSCGCHVFYPRLICPHCAADGLEWRTASGRGTVYATTVVRRPDKAGGPYNVALVDLDEGVRMMSRVVGMAPGMVAIGMRVRATIVDLAGGRAPVFEREEQP